jgi:uridine kinase
MIKNGWTREISRLNQENETLKKIISNYEAMEKLRQDGYIRPGKDLHDSIDESCDPMAP